MFWVYSNGDIWRFCGDLWGFMGFMGYDDYVA
jgi:hypothetical protein